MDNIQRSDEEIAEGAAQPPHRQTAAGRGQKTDSRSRRVLIWTA